MPIFHQNVNGFPLEVRARIGYDPQRKHFALPVPTVMLVYKKLGGPSAKPHGPNAKYYQPNG